MSSYRFLTAQGRVLAERVEFIYKGAKTKRFHTADTLTTQTVGEHSFGVAWLVVLLRPSARKELILAALSHDLAEHVVGDVSSVAKRAYPELKAALDAAEGTVLKQHSLDFETGLTDDEVRVLKVADLMDGMLFCVRERRMGSKVAVEIFNNFSAYVRTIPSLWEEAEELFLTIQTLWEKANAS